MMSSYTINVLLTSFPGLGLPSTLSLPIDSARPIAELWQRLTDRLPSIKTRLILTTTSNRELQSLQAPILTLLPSSQDTLLPLRLSVPLCGGKGGFGSQLRAAGGRMSSRKKNNHGEHNSSNRNLDGRRLRTVNEAKALAEYLALKPEMERNEREERRRRWEQVVAVAERREEDICSGSKGKIDGKWVEDKDEAGERTREAVLMAMQTYCFSENLKRPSADSVLGGSAQTSEGSEDEESEEVAAQQVTRPSNTKHIHMPTKTCFGFDEDDEFLSDEGEQEEESTSGVKDENIFEQASECKGKGKARPGQGTLV